MYLIFDTSINRHIGWTELEDASILGANYISKPETEEGWNDFRNYQAEIAVPETPIEGE